MQLAQISGARDQLLRKGVSMRVKIHNIEAAMAGCSILLCLLGVLNVAPTVRAQSIFNTNLIVNGNAEAGPAGSLSSLAASIPGWTRSTDRVNVNVLPYGLTGALQTSGQIPPDHGFQYFGGTQDDFPDPGTITQTVDVSSAASAINAGDVEYSASAYLGSAGVDAEGSSASMAVAFKNAAGQTINTITLGPLHIAIWEWRCSSRSACFHRR